MARRRAPVLGSELLRDVERRLKAGWPPGLATFAGEDAYHRDQALEQVLEALLPDGGDAFSLTVYRDARVEVEAVVNAARTVPMFAPRRVVVVRDADLLEGDPQPLGAYAKAPPPESHLLIRAEKLDLRRKLGKILAGQGVYFEFPAPEPALWPRLVPEVVALGRRRGLEVQRQAAALLVDIAAGDLARVSVELDKISLLLGEGKDRKVTPGLVQATVSGGGAMSGWEVAEALLRRDLQGALRACRRLVESGEEPLRLLAGLAWRMRTLLEAKALQLSGAPEKSLIQAGRAWRDRETFLEALDRYRLEELRAAPSRLLAVDRAFKSRQADRAALLELLLHDLTLPGRLEGKEAGA